MPTSSKLTPSLAVRLLDGPDTPAALCDAFATGTGAGLLFLGATDVVEDQDATLGWWRDFARHFIVRACSAIDPTNPSEVRIPVLEPDFVERTVASAPPMQGGEFVSADALSTLWTAMGEALTFASAGHETGVQGYLDAHGSAWHVAGRVCLHLAENKADPARPFAFIATYARHVSGRKKLQYLPLNKALQEYAGAGNRAQLLALLSPLDRARAASDVIRDLVDSRQIYQALAWTAAEAHAFLQDIDAMRQAGLAVRLPDWWRARKRPVVAVRIGDAAPASIGLGGLLDFDVSVTLGGEPLSDGEIDAILGGNRRLALVRGQWVEADGDRLREVLDQWQNLRDDAEAGGISLTRALRLWAGTESPGPAPELDDDFERDAWSQVIAGDWLRTRLDALRRTDGTTGGYDAKTLHAELVDRGLQAILRPYQLTGVHWLRTLRALRLGGCLADDMGLGKTIQVIALLLTLQQDQGDAPQVDLLIVPASLLENWRTELAKFAPSIRVLIAHGSVYPTKALRALSAEEVERHDVVISSYGTAIRTPWIAERRWRCLVLDEAQAIKNPGAKQTRAIKRLSAEWRLALTGTPVENRLADLWSLFDFLNPGLLGGAREFGRLCSAMERREKDGFGPLRRLVSPYILRRLKTDRSVISDLPDKVEMTARCLLSREQAALYQDAVDALELALKTMEPKERRGIVLAFMMRFKQICNHPAQWLGDDRYSAARSGKFERLAEIADTVAGRQEKLLVFTQFRTLTQPLNTHLGTVFGAPGLVLHGGTPVKRRPDLVQAFQEGDAPFMVLSLRAGGTGLNLTAANHVVHFDQWWNPAVENQATDRAFRIGQRRNVLVHKFMCPGTIEERIDQMIAAKQEVSNEVLGADRSDRAITELDDKELMHLVRLDLHAAVVS